MDIDNLVNWIGAIVLVIGIITSLFYWCVQIQNNETLQEQCFDDCTQIFATGTDRMMCIKDICSKIENGNTLKKNLIDDDKWYDKGRSHITIN